MREHSFLSLSPHGFHRVVYSEFGNPRNERVLICVHGLTRNGRDFDTLAEALCDHYRVICPDVPGRGRSDWLPVKDDYGYPLYCTAMAALIAHLNVETVHWVGTSMGGLIGMLLAAQPGTPIKRLVMNDVGPLIPKAALERIASYVGETPRFESMQALEAYIREIYSPFGPLSDAQWQSLVESSARSTGDGDYGLNYDPAIAAPLKAMPMEDLDLWPMWDRVNCPVLLIRGEKSDVLLRDTAEEMRRRGPKAKLIELSGIGHAPTLMTESQIASVRDWLL
jgi:pimeloyl-ACP methyl ester carboxylesterase